MTDTFFLSLFSVVRLIHRAMSQLNRVLKFLIIVILYSCRHVDVSACISTSSSLPLDFAGKDDDTTTRTALIIVVSIAACLMLSVTVGILLRKRIKQKFRKKLESELAADEISTVDSIQYDFDKIEAATNGFSDANKLGEDGFGAVYRGKLLNGREIVVKRLSGDSRQGNLDFKNEVLTVARLQHRNLVRLLGFSIKESIKESERLLVYEFVRNGSLDKFILDPIKRSYLDWNKRCKIIEGIAQGLLYLHENSRLRSIHGDLKANNILLDGEMKPKISDFGTSRIVGTYGYTSPEYAMHGQFFDVFSFGVLVLEIVSCVKNRKNAEDLLSSTWNNWCQGTAANLIDPVLKANTSSLRDMLRCIHIGLLCVQENAANRPTMASVVLMLNYFSITLPLPSKPACFRASHYGSDISVFQEYNSKELKSNKTSKSKTDTAEDSYQIDV